MAPIAIAERIADRSQPGSVLVCRYGSCQYVFCFSFFDSSQCTGNAGWAIYIYGLYKSRITATGDNGNRDGICIAVAVSFLKPLPNPLRGRGSTDTPVY